MPFGKLKQIFKSEKSMEEIRRDLLEVNIRRGAGYVQKCEQCGSYCTEKYEHHNAYFPTHFFCDKKCHNKWINKIQRKRGWN